jgi:hypothetical protein
MPLIRSRVLFLLAGIPALAQRKEPVPYVASATYAIHEIAPGRAVRLPRPSTFSLGRLSTEERAKLGTVGAMRRVGLHRTLAGDALAKGSWIALSDGRRIWRVAIQSAQATGLRLEFTNFETGAGKVWIYTANSADGPYTGRGPYGNGEFWSATLEGDSATIEYQPENSTPGSVPFHIHRIAHRESYASDAPQTADSAASCNLDVNCYHDWLSTKASVAQIQFEETLGPEQGTFLCSGALVGTRDDSLKPYLLTAGHCIHDEPAARSLETFWAFESAGCNLGPPMSRGSVNSQNGGHLLAWNTIEQGDYSLVLLPDVPSGVVFSGWDTNDPPAGVSLTGIHHPEGSYKRISFGHLTDSVDVFVGNDFAPAGLYQLVAWDQGVTEPGSSGSPLFSGPGVLVGTLTYGPDAPGEQLCLSGAIAGYGKFSNAYRFLQPYLEDFPSSQVTPSTTNLQFTGLNHAITGNATQTVALAVASSSPVVWSARADAPWLGLSRLAGTVSSNAPARFDVSVDPNYFLTSDTYTSTITILSGAAPPVFVNVSVNMKIDKSNVMATANPNPVPQDGTSWTLTLNLQETAGAATTVTALKIDGVDYSGNIERWFGSANLSANGFLSASIHTSGLFTPVTKYFEFYGIDAGSGQSWYRLVPVTFTN